MNSSKEERGIGITSDWASGKGKLWTNAKPTAK